MRCCRNLTLVYINWLMVKLVLLCVFHLKSQNLGTTLSEDINSTPLTDIASHWRTLGLGAASIQSRLSRVLYSKASSFHPDYTIQSWYQKQGNVGPQRQQKHIMSDLMFSWYFLRGKVLPSQKMDSTNTRGNWIAF